MQVASVCWDVGCVEVQPKHKMTNRCAALEEEDDGEMAHPPRLAETYGVCAVQKFQKIKRVEVTVVPRRVCGQPSCCKRSPRWKEERKKKVLVVRKRVIMAKEDQVWRRDGQHDDDVF